MHKFVFIAFILFCKTIVAQQKLTARQEEIVDNYINKGAQSLISYYGPRWQIYCDSAIALDSTIAYLWQQKAMPLYKQQKYEVAEPCLLKAVKYDSTWLSYYGFMCCIFQHDYVKAKKVFTKCIAQNPDGVVMDHSFSFYISLCHLQLNEFAAANKLLNEIVDKQKAKNGFVHYLSYYYQGVSYYEQLKFVEAKLAFQNCLKEYNNCPDALYFLARCYHKFRDDENYKLYKDKATQAFEGRNRINEDNCFYELYPYQLFPNIIPKY